MGPFLINSLLPLVAPALFAASIYMELGRLIIVLHAQQHSLIRVKWLTKIFVTGDVLSFLLQAGGKEHLQLPRNRYKLMLNPQSSTCRGWSHG